MSREENEALDHVAWLARKNRHTNAHDHRANIAIKMGWVFKVSGIMTGDDWHMFRLELTPVGRVLISQSGVSK